MNAPKRKMTEAELDAYLARMSVPQLSAAAESMEILAKKKREGMFYSYSPMPHQVPIHADIHKIITVMGGNRSGKSHCCAYSVACHILGEYPSWWQGVKFNKPIDCGVISISTEQLRKSAQVKLMGEPHEIGTGFIPADRIIDKAWRSGSNGCLDWVLVRHASGGSSRINFMTNEQGQSKFMGFAWNLCWFDEEPDINVFSEVKMRMIDKKGYIILSFYPYNGTTEVIRQLDAMPEKVCSHYALSMEDNQTLDPEEVRMHIEAMPEWERESRVWGRPGVGEGRIFTMSRDEYTVDPFEIEPSWRQIAGLDPGFGHPTGAISLAIDDQADCVYVYREYLSERNVPAVHASSLRRWGDIEFKIDPSSRRESPTDGKRVYDLYVEEGLNVTKALTGPDSVMTSINMINQMLAQKRLFIFSTCRDLLRQMGLYRMKKDSNGKASVVKRDDDLIDPLRMAILHLEEARVPGTPKIKVMPKIKEWSPVDKKIGI